MPALVGRPSGLLPSSFGAGGRVLLILDGLGWNQLQRYSSLMPTLASFSGGPITTVAPSTTATAMTSITTALGPADHGIVGYRMVIDDAVFNCLRWGSKGQPDARSTAPAELLQPYEPFMGENLPIVTKSEFRMTGFTKAHLRGGRLKGYATPAVLVHNVAQLLNEGEEAVYAYYDGIDKVGHQYGLGSEYEAELRFVDRLIADLLEQVPSGTSVMISADHGQLECPRLIDVDSEVLSLTEFQSGEARFRWLHAKQGRIEQLHELAEQRHGNQAWVVTRQTMIEQNWFGGRLSEDVAMRYGDVALLPFDDVGFFEADDSGPMDLIGRHGSLTPDEMYVPCITSTV